LITAPQRPHRHAQRWHHPVRHQHHRGWPGHAATMRARVTVRWRLVTIPCRTAHAARGGVW